MISIRASVLVIWICLALPESTCFLHVSPGKPRQSPLFFFGNNAKIPTNPNDRDAQAIQGIKAAIQKPKTRGFGLLECEFPPLASLNKLGDGSMQSAKQVDAANLAFTKKLVSSLAPFGLGPKVWVLTSASAGANSKAKQAGGTLHSLRDGLPSVAASDVCVLVQPAGRPDYDAAKKLAKQCKAVVLVNGFAKCGKDPSSVPGTATMAFYLKPLTYNSQVVGYLARTYPGPWNTIDGTTSKVLQSVSDAEILVSGTNTPDLRASGRLVQKAVDERAMKARQLQ